MPELNSQNQEIKALIPQETTHKQITERVLLRLANDTTIVINGPSRSGKSTYLDNSLRPVLAKQGNKVCLANCMQLLEQEAIAIIQTSDDVLILDEAFRLSHSDEFIEKLKERDKLGKKTVLVNTLLEDDTEQIKKIIQLSSSQTIEFPLEMELEDAKRLVSNASSGLSEAKQNDLLNITTNPSILRNMIKICERQENTQDISVTDTISTALVNGDLYFEPSLASIKKRIYEFLNVPLPVRMRKTSN